MELAEDNFIIPKLKSSNSMAKFTAPAIIMKTRLALALARALKRSRHCKLAEPSRAWDAMEKLINKK